MERILGHIVNVCLLAQFILMWSLHNMRTTYGSIGIFITGWALLCLSLSLIVSPLVVSWGKAHEEVRLTGRRETRRTIKEWFKVSLSFTLLLILVVIPGLLIFLGFLLDVYDTSQLMSSSGAASAGTFVSVPSSPGNSYSVFIECTPMNRKLIPPLPDDQEAPIVLIEADDRVSAQSLYEGWVEELFHIKKVSRVCFWNRPGRGFSDNAPSPFSLRANSEALTVALNSILDREKAPLSFIEREAPPFQNQSLALIAHGIGGLYARHFAARHISSIHSIMLVDTLHEDILRRTIGPIKRGFGLWLEGMLSPLAIERQLSWIVHGYGPSDRYLSSANIASQQTSGHLAFNTKSSEIKASLQEQIAAVSGSIQRDIKLSNDILQHSNIPVAVAVSAQSVRKDREWSFLQRKLAKITANVLAFDVYDGPHEIWTARKAKEQLQDVYTLLLREKKAE